MIVPQNTIKFIKQLKKENIDFRADKKIVVLNSFTADYIFDSTLCDITYDMTKLPFQVPEDISEFTALTKIYYKQLQLVSYLPYQIITMNYNTIVAEMLKNLRINQSEMSHVSDWQIFAFFLEDEYLNDLKINNANLLDIKVDEVVSMLDYPFIKKIEFPLHYNITTDYFFNLIFCNDLDLSIAKVLYK